MDDLITWAAANSRQRDETAARLRRLLERGANGETAASLPEVFDIIVATSRVEPGLRRTANALNLQARIAKLLKEMKPGPPHRAVVNWALEFRVPLLTANYDHCFQDVLAGNVRKFRFVGSEPLDRFYPWDRHYAPTKIKDPIPAFAIWHIHGDRAIRSSIRAGLDQYMGIAQRLRGPKLQIGEILDVAVKKPGHAPAFHKAPWLRAFFGNRLWIQGLGLRSAEVTIRWLLIERLRYWRRFRADHDRESGWYIHGPTDKIGPLDQQRRSFLEGVGLKVIEIAESNETYLELFMSNQKTNA